MALIQERERDVNEVNEVNVNKGYEDLPRGFEHLRGWSIEKVKQRMDELSAAAEGRRPAGFSDILGVMGGAGVDLMTSAERTELHALKLMLPSMAEERMAAKERIQARLQARRRGKDSASCDVGNCA